MGIIIEVKKPSNKAEMINEAKPNAKALHELVLYYFRERTEHNNIDTKHLIITNIYEWYIFDEVWFDKNVYRNTKLKKDYENWKLSGHDTKFFYDSIAKPFIETLTEEIPCTFFDIKKYTEIVANAEKKDDNQLIALYKILSPVYLLKQAFANDSNSLDTKFYSELLHIIGLEEIKDGGKKLIKQKTKPDEASLLENTIAKLEDKEVLRNISDLKAFGKDKNEQLFNVSLELCITWINRILFLKLLEAQLYKYHQGNKDFEFLNTNIIFDFDELSVLFFQVLAEKQENRRQHLKSKFSKVPYLNSSLFERTELERLTFDISALDNRFELPIFSASVLKDEQGKRKAGKFQTLRYLFDFLTAYDFTSEGKEEIQEDNKNLINASVLGLIFEKINGYKDGSFFTPGFVTMYMCKETIQRAVIQKFNERYNIDCEAFDDLKNFVANRFKAKDILEFNSVINELKICDPAVGSGHFLVSALNEIIATKADLGILADSEGVKLAGYEVKIENDELIITYNNNSEIFEYTITNGTINKETQRVQKTLFLEKQTIIENCLFGVDININSVKICRLRLWIELLKNAYYKSSPIDDEGVLETLPNIDINIKCGNSLISRFALNADLSKALKSIKWNVNDYKSFVQDYHHATDKEAKKGLESLIQQIKQDFRTEIHKSDDKVKKLNELTGTLFIHLNQKKVFEPTAKEAEDFELRTRFLETEIEKRSKEIEEIKNNKIFENAFEWRFEFPEVLDNEGNFIGFDAIIGNPPYSVIEKERNTTLEPYKNILEYSETTGVYTEVEGGKQNLYRLFIKLGIELLKSKGFFGFITPLTLIGDNSLFNTRKYVFLKFEDCKLMCFPQKDNPSHRVFEDAKQSTVIFTGLVNKLNISKKEYEVFTFPGKSFSDTYKHYKFTAETLIKVDKKNLSIPLVSQKEMEILTKLHNDSITFRDFDGIVIRRGEINQTIYRKYITKNTSYFSLLKGVEVGKYQINTKLSQGEKEYFDEISYNKDGFSNNLKNLNRIVLQRITGVDEKLRLVAALVTFPSYFADSTNSIHLIGELDFKIEFILGLMNSKLFQWRFKKTSTNNNVSTTEIESLPFRVNNKISLEVENNVVKILDLKNNDSKNDISFLENQIDQLVYQLYDLTEEEIEIIENK